MQKRAKWVRRGLAILLAFACFPLALFALSAETCGVASEQSGEKSVCAGTLVDAGKRPGAGSSEGSAVAWLASKGLTGAVVLHTGSATGLLSAVKSGAGIAALPCIVAEREPDLMRCYPLARDNSSFMWLLTHERLRHTPRVRAVMDFLYERLKKLAV